MSEIKGCMNCGNISCGNNKKRESAGCGRWISPEDKKMKKDEMKNRISMALKDAILQQGFEIICKKLTELEKENAEIKEKLGIYQKGMFDEIEKRDIKLTKAKEIIKTYYEDNFDEAEFYSLRKKAEQFLSEVEK